MHFSCLHLKYRYQSTFADSYSKKSLIFKDLQGYFVYLFICCGYPKGTMGGLSLDLATRCHTMEWISFKQAGMKRLLSPVSHPWWIPLSVGAGRRMLAVPGIYFNRIVPTCIPGILCLCAGERRLRPTRTKRHSWKGLLFRLSLLCQGWPDTLMLPHGRGEL